jgi:hypothetical protein
VDEISEQSNDETFVPSNRTRYYMTKHRKRIPTKPHVINRSVKLKVKSKYRQNVSALASLFANFASHYVVVIG